MWHFEEGSGSRSEEDDTDSSRYVRLYCDDLWDYLGNGNYQVYVGEFGAETFDGTNEALSGSASASSTHPGYPASNTIDGATTTWWDANPTADPDAEEWLKIDLGSSKEIEHLDFFWYHVYWPPRHAYVQVSINGSDWQNIAEISHESVPISYPERYQTVPVRQTASWASGITWGNNHGERGVGGYAREYTYDKVGNRTSMRLFDTDGSTLRDATWTMEYNDLNQLTDRATGAAGDERWLYAYDANGNLVAATQETSNGSVWSVSEECVYQWNPRDQMTRAIKYVNGSANNAGSVDYQYCLSCDGALSKRLQYGPGTGAARGSVISGQRYEYDGLSLLRMDELYDSDSDGLDQDDIDADAWRARELSTHRPGALGALLHKTVYEYPSLTSTTSNANTEYTYTYDPVGNVAYVYYDDGDLAYEFSQDAFGNELKIGTLGGNEWLDAAGDGVSEHQTGKWMDEFTGLYYFWARWYDGEVGRFVGRDKVKACHFYSHPYAFVRNSSTRLFDPDGNFAWEDEYVPSNKTCSPGQKIEMKGLIYRSCNKLEMLLGDSSRWSVTQLEVLECVLGRCRHGKMGCRCGCPGTIKGRTDYAPGWKNEPGVLQPINAIFVCFDLTHGGGSALHEWGHECGCDHPERQSEGGDYVDGGGCGFLPAGTKRRGLD